jgi:hypothetical protein
MINYLVIHVMKTVSFNFEANQELFIIVVGSLAHVESD